ASGAVGSNSIYPRTDAAAFRTRQCVRTAPRIRGADQGPGQGARADAQLPASATAGVEQILTARSGRNSSGSTRPSVHCIRARQDPSAGILDAGSKLRAKLGEPVPVISKRAKNLVLEIRASDEPTEIGDNN